MAVHMAGGVSARPVFDGVGMMDFPISHVMKDDAFVKYVKPSEATDPGDGGVEG